MIIGLDISTRYVGYCVLQDDGSFVKVGHLDLSKEKNLYKKLDLFHVFFTTFPVEYQVFVESPLQRSNNQNVVNLLQRWNGMLCSVLYRHFDSKEPIMIEQRTALKELGIKIPKGIKGKDRKKYILQWVKDRGIIPEDNWAVKRTGNPKDWCFDRADAYIIAASGRKKLDVK